MQILDALPDPSGLYVLTPQGELGYYDRQRRFRLDAALSAALSEHCRGYLQSYLADPEAGRYRVAIVYAARIPKAWGPITMYLEEFVIRELYPVSGQTGKELTAFQKKNRTKSLYRGMELLLEHRSESAPEALNYCPVLFDRQMTCARYLPGLDLPEAEVAREAPVVEMLNLVANIPPTRRAMPAFLALREKLRHGLIRKDKRRPPKLELLENTPSRWESQASAEDAYADVDKRDERAITLDGEDLGRLHTQQRIEQVEQWLEIPHRPVDPGRLRGFLHFRDLDPARLALLAAKSLVYTAPAGARLLERGMTDPWNLYLLEGVVALAPGDGPMLLVESGSDKAASPIAFLKPRKYTVTATTKVSFLWIHDVLLKVVLDGSRPPLP